MLKKLFSEPKQNWGRICLLVFIVLFILAAFTAFHKRSSSDFGTFKVFARYDAKSKGIIKDPPKRLRVIMHGKSDMDIDLSNLSASSDPDHKTELNADGLTIHGVNFNVSVGEDIVWHSPVTISRDPEGDKVDYDLDARLSSIHGIYVVKNNAVIKHYYQETQICFVLLVIIGMPVVYIVGKIVILIVNRRRGNQLKP